MVLAAGLGRRLAPFTDRIPKPLLPLCDVPLIRYGLERLVEQGVTSIAVNLHHGAGLLAEYLQGPARMLRASDGAPVSINLSFEETLQGTGGGIAAARPFLGGKTLLVVNSDLLFEFDLATLLAFHRERSALATVLLHSGQGREWLRSTASDSDGRLTSIVKAGPEDPSRGVFSGIYVLEPEVYDTLPLRPSSVVTEGFVPAMERGLAFGLKSTFPWWDLGHWSTYHQACMAVLAESPRDRRASGDFPRVLASTPGRFSPGGRGPIYLGPGVELPAQVRRNSGFAAIGAGCRLAADASVNNSVVLPGTTIAGKLSNVVAGQDWLTRQ